MAAQAVFQEQREALNGRVRAWDRRLRAQKTLIWLPRSAIPGLILGVIMLLMARTRPWLTNEQIAAITAGSVLVGIVIMLLVVWLWPRSDLEIARSFDVMFNLGERTSTALELIAGKIRSNEELTAFQLRDAWEKAQVINARERIPLIWDWRSWLGVLGILGVFVLLLLIPNPHAEAISQDNARARAVAEAETTVEEITQNVAADPALTDEERAQLLQKLEKTSSKLEEPEIKPEEAFASLSDAESELREQAQSLSQSVEDQRAAMEQAAEALRALSAMPNVPEQSGQPQDAIPTLQELQQNMEGMSEAARMETADALEQAAQALEQTNSQAAQSLREAANALRNGDMQAAQNALQQAAENMRQGQQQMQQQSSSAQQLSQAAQQLRQATNQITQSGQPNSQTPPNQQPGQQGQNQQGRQQTSEGIQQLQQQSEQASGQQPGQGQQAGNSQSQQGQEGQQPGEQGQPGNQAGQIQANAPGEGQEGSSSESQQAGSQQPGEGSGAGDTQGDAGGESNRMQGSSNTGAQDNDPDGGGEGQMPLIYSPQRVGGSGGEQLFLEPDSGDIPVTEGEFSQNPAGQSLVPYNQVFGEYRTEANRALESDYIPLGLRDVVKEYFTSLEPGQRGGGR
jgi:methyl-accepting chemotaxis protein